MSIHVGVNGVVRTVRRPLREVSGTFIPIGEGWAGVNGVNRQFLGGKVYADEVEKVVMSHFLIDYHTINSNGSTTGIIIPNTFITSDEQLTNLIAPYPELSITFDKSKRHIICGGTIAVGKSIQVIFKLYVVLKTGVVVDLYRLKSINPEGYVSTYFLSNGNDMSMYDYVLGFSVGGTLGTEYHKDVYIKDCTNTLCQCGVVNDSDSSTSYKSAELGIESVYIDGKTFTPELSYMYNNII